MSTNTNKQNYSECFIIEKPEIKSEEKPSMARPSWKNNDSNKKAYRKDI